MARIVFAWEFGGGMGHIQRILPLAKQLQQRNHEVICIMKHVIDAEKIMGRHDIRIIQAPAWQMNIKQLPTSYNYSDTLFNLGYLVRGAVRSMTRAWYNLFEFIGPDLMIADHAPTALLAARGGGFKRALYGTGFLCPPRKSPMPSIISWIKPPLERMEYSETRALEIINDALQDIGLPLLGKLYNLFDVEENFLATFKELDHYQDREPVKYWGPVISLPEGEKPQWPGNGRYSKKIFCYLKPSYPLLGSLLDEMQKIEAGAIIYSPNLPDKVIKEIQRPNFLFLKKPADMHMICRESDLVICHGGHGTSAVSLLHGTPLLLLPEHDQLEQILTGYNLAGAKYGIMATTKLEDKKVFGQVIRKLLTEPVFTEQAKIFAKKYKDFNSEEQLRKIADRCEELISED